MAIFNADLNKATEFNGGSDVLRCDLIKSSFNGVRVQADGVILEDVTVKVRMPGSQTKFTVELEEGSGPYALVGAGFELAEIEISDVPEGEWIFIFRQ